jgi:hypothetical protein
LESGGIPIGCRIPLALYVAAVALTFFHFRLGGAFAVGRERFSDLHLFLEFAFLIAANVTPAAVRADYGALARFAFFLGSHLSLHRGKGDQRFENFGGLTAFLQPFQIVASLIREFTAFETEQALPW